MRLADVRVAVGHPLGHELGDAGAFLDPHRSGRPKVAYFDGLAEHRHGVGREGQQTVDGIPNFRRLKDLGHELEGLFHLRIEVLIGQRQLGGRKRRSFVRRDVIRVHEDRAVSVGADLHRASGLTLVTERVHVPNDGVGQFLAGLLQDFDRTDVGHLVHGGRERDVGAGHGGNAGAPHATGDDHVLALDATLVRYDCADGTVGRFHRHHFGVGEDLQGIFGLGLFAQQRSCTKRVNGRHAGRVEATEQNLFVDEGNEFFDLFGRDELGRDAPGLGRGHAAIELLHALGRAGNFDAAALGVHAEFHVLTLRVERE